MNAMNKYILMFNLPDLLRNIRYDEHFQRLLLSKGIFHPDHIEAFQKGSKPTLEMFLALMQVEQKEYMNFVDALKETNQETCLRILENESRVPAKFRDGNTSAAYRSKQQGLHGMALIMNYCEFDNDKEKKRDRQGPKKNVADLKELLEQLRYEVVIKSDLTLEETHRELKAFRDNEAHADADSTIVIVMIHGGHEKIKDNSPNTVGNGENYICTKDGKKLASQQIIDYFNSADCQNLAGKPKMFFIQAFRDAMLDILPPEHLRLVVDACPIYPEKPRPARIIPTVSDALMSYATTPDNVDDSETSASHIVQAICKVFKEYASERDVETLMFKAKEEVQKMVSHGRQGRENLDEPRILKTWIESKGFNKKFYFKSELASQAI